MKPRRKELLLLVAPLLVFGCVWTSAIVANHCSDSCVVQLGDFTSGKTADKAAFGEISRQIKRCPKASLYVTRYNLVIKGVKMDDVAIKFEPSNGILVYEPDNSAKLEMWKKVDAHILSLVDSTGGSKKLGCQQVR